MPRRDRVSISIALLEHAFTSHYVESVFGISRAAARRYLLQWIAGGLIVPHRSAEEERYLVTAAAREAALDNTTPAQRQRAFAESARRLIESPSAADFDIEIARHVRDSGKGHDAFTRFFDAYERRSESGRHQEAREVLAEIFTTLTYDSAEAHLLLVAGAQNAELLGDRESAMHLLEQLRRRAAARSDGGEFGTTLLRQAILELGWDRYREAAEYAGRSLRLVSRTDAAAKLDRIRGDLILGECALALGDRTGALRFAEAALQDGDPLPEVIEPHYAFLRARLWARREPDRAAQELRSAAIGLLANSDALHAVRALEFASESAFAAADLHGSFAMLHEAADIAARNGIPYAEHRVALAKVRLLIEAGRLSEALDIVRARALFSQTARTDGDASALALAVAERDEELMGAFESPETLDRVLASESLRRITSVVPAYASLARHRGRAIESEVLLERAAMLALSVDDADVPEPAFFIDLARHVAQERLVTAGAVFEKYRSGTGELVQMATVVAEAIVDERRGSLSTTSTIIAVEQSLRERGFYSLARKAAAVVADAHVGSRNAKILVLIQAGCTNAQIGKELHLSKRTVENAVSELLRTYGFRSRWQLAHLPRPT